MSLEFNRRSFLKYTALTAVAFAGSSLLTGCELENSMKPVRKLGQSANLMQSTFTLDSAALSGTSTLNCGLTIKCGSKNGIRIWPENFQVVVTEKDSKTSTVYNSTGTQGGERQLTLSKTHNSLQKGETFQTVLTVNNIRLTEGCTVEVQCWPRLISSVPGNETYNDMFVTWKLTYTAGKLA